MSGRVENPSHNNNEIRNLSLEVVEIDTGIWAFRVAIACAIHLSHYQSYFSSHPTSSGNEKDEHVKVIIATSV